MGARGNTSLAELNEKVWNDKFTAWNYKRSKRKLFPAEEAIFASLKERITDKKILDIGVGAGRTAPYLHALSEHYIGSDFSAEMVAQARSSYPEINFLQVDARDLSRFDDASFDFVLFSFNGIDLVSHQDRLKVLAEVNRVVDPNGYFAFSAHNRDFTIPKIYSPTNIDFTINPVKLGYRLVNYGHGIYKYIKFGKHEEDTKEYQINLILESLSANFVYYISVPEQVAQLERANFRLIQAYGVAGETVSEDEKYHDGFMVYYLCGKAMA